MGRKNKSYSKDLHQQAYERLTRMQKFGESKKEAMADGSSKDKIFSIGTYKTYWKHIKYFIAYIKEHHPECTTLKSQLCALEMFNEDYVTFPRDDIAKLSGLSMPVNKRN